MREQKLPHFCGIDVGTATIRCVVGTVNEQGEAEIIGHSDIKNQGMRKGIVVHPDEVGELIRNAVTDAERISGRSITTATVNVNGAHVTGVNSRGVIAVSAANREITNEDRLRAEEAAAIMQLPANRAIIQVFPKNYRLDGQDNIKNPVGMHGVRLEVDTHIVTAALPNLKTLDSALERGGIIPLHRTVSSLAAAEAVLTRQQREAGTVLLDIGAGTTNLVVIEDGEVQHVAILPIGGINITNDLAIGLKTDLEIAEQIKIEHANISSNPAKRSVATVNHEGKQYTFSTDDISMIVEARIEELFELVDKELKKIQRSRKLPGGVVLVGATAKLPGIEEVAKETLQLAARKGVLLPIGGLQDVSEDLGYTSAVGLMLLDLILDGQSGFSEKEALTSVFKSVSGIFKRRKSGSR